MGEGSRIIGGILALAQFFLAYLWFSIGYAELGLAWLGVGILGLIFVIVYDTDTFKELEEDIRKRMLLMIIAASCVGGIIGYFLYGIVGATYGVCIGGILTEAIGAVYILFFTSQT
jgi:uncharacterized membrane protein